MSVDVGNRSSGLGTLILKFVPGQIIPGLLAFLAVPILTRTMDSQQFGLLSLVQVTVLSLNMFGFAWASNCGLRFFRTMEGREPAFYMSLLVSVLLTLGVFVATLGVAWPWLPEKYHWILLVSLPLVFTTGMVSTLVSVLRAQSKALSYSLVTSLSAFMRYIPGIAVILLFSCSVQAFTVAWTVGTLLELVFVIWMAEAWKGLYRARPDLKVMKEFLAYGMPILLVGIGTWAMNSLDRFLIDFFRGEQEVAYYTVGSQLGGTPMQLLSSTIMLAVLPKAIDTFEAGQDYTVLISRGMRYLLLTVVPIGAVLGILSRPLLKVYAGPEYGQAGTAMMLLLLALIIQAAAHYYRMPFMVHRRTKPLVAIGALSALAGLVANLVLVPWLGFTGSAIAMAASCGIMLVLSVAWSRSMLPGRCWPVESTVRIGLSAAVTMACGWLIGKMFDLNSMAALAVAAISLCVICAGMLYLTGEVRDDVRELSGVARRYLRKSKDAIAVGEELKPS